MSTLDDGQKLYGELLKAGVEWRRTMANWGLSMSLGGIALLSKQLIEWDQSADLTKRVCLHPAIFMLPVIVGILSLTFLRVNNYRRHEARKKLCILAGQSESTSLGFAGLFTDLMPLALGYAATRYLLVGPPERQVLIFIATGLGIVALFCAFLHQFWHRRDYWVQRRAHRMTNAL